MFVLGLMWVNKDQDLLNTHCRFSKHFCAVFKVRTQIIGYCISKNFETDQCSYFTTLYLKKLYVKTSEKNSF